MKSLEVLVAQPDVEAFLAAVLHKVLVAANPSRLKGLKSKTYILRQKFQAELTSEESCSSSSETRWTERGNSSTPAWKKGAQ